jgi:hypothetical protein
MFSRKQVNLLVGTNQEGAGSAIETRRRGAIQAEPEERGLFKPHLGLPAGLRVFRRITPCTKQLVPG